jgi:hypothetical protein
MRALAEAEHPQFRPEANKFKHVVRRGDQTDHSSLFVLYDEVPDVLEFKARCHHCHHPMLVVAIQLEHPAAWWTLANVTGVLDALERTGFAVHVVELLKSVVAIMADDERREV